MHPDGNSKQAEMQVGLSRCWFANEHERPYGPEERVGLMLICKPKSAIRNRQRDRRSGGISGQLLSGIREGEVGPQKRSLASFQRLQNIFGGPLRCPAMANPLFKLG